MLKYAIMKSVGSITSLPTNTM